MKRNGRTITIRTKDELKSKEDYIVKMLISASKKYPLVYKYPGGDDASKPDPEDVIGEVCNIRPAKNGDILGDVKIFPMLEKSKHFTGKIDNIVGRMEPTILHGQRHLIPTVVSFIVYDHFAKDVIDSKRKETKNEHMHHLEKSPVEAKIATDKNINPLQDVNIRDAIENSLNEFLSEGGEPDGNE